MKIAILGIGLMGGSLAKGLKKSGFATEIIGINTGHSDTTKALELEVIDKILPLQNALEEAEITVLSTPIDVIQSKLIEVLDNIPEGKIVTDLGSTKHSMAMAVKNHPKRSQYVSAHPIAGTEFSGVENALEDLYKNKITILCNEELSSKNSFEKVTKMFESLGSNIIKMSSEDHDKHIAYVSHISHISSFALAGAVMEIENNDNNIFNMAGSGFASTVRLANSSANMWAPIFNENKKYILEALGMYKKHLHLLEEYILKSQTDDLKDYINNVNKIGAVLKRNK